jgi:hypothetical protein
MLSEQQIREQSINAYTQWAPQWRAHAKEHSKYKQLSLIELENTGVGKACLVVANGYSFEENIETIKKHQDKVDIFCCDKTLGHLLDHGIVPKYCMVCDANVNYEKYLEPWKDKLDQTTLLMNVCGNPEWTEKGNWKRNYFFVNMDVMKYEEEFIAISGCGNKIPAGTNVSNAMIVMLTQSNNQGRNNFFGYDKYLTIGFDYSWVPGKKYYAFNEDGGGKANYMRHVYLVNNAGEYCYTSGNLLFSAQWLQQYVNSFKLPVVQCSKSSILGIAKYGKLEEQMQYRFRPEDQTLVKSSIERKNKLTQELSQLNKVLKKVAYEHYYSYVGSV